MDHHQRHGAVKRAWHLLLPQDRRTAVRRPTCRPALLALEPRELLSTATAFEPTVNEQYMLQLINRARQNPQAEVQRLLEMARTDPAVRQMTNGWDLDLFARTLGAIAPQPPLAFNTRLIEAARDHNGDMLATNDQHHSPAGYLTDTRVATADDGRAYYNTTGASSWSTGENVYAYSANVTGTELSDYVDYFHAGFMIDWGNPDFGHLYNIMAPGPGNLTGGSRRAFSEIGIGLLESAHPTQATPSSPALLANYGLNVGPVIVTQEFGYRSGSTFLTGVFSRDLDQNAFYTPGEGLGGVLIRAVGAEGQGTFETTTWSSGGYSLALPRGTYSVTASATGFPARSTTITVDQNNVGWEVTYPARTNPDQPAKGDFNGDRRDEIALFQPDTGLWKIPASTASAAPVTTIAWGLPGDRAVAADYDGDGRADPAVYRPSEGRWYVRGSTGAIQYGIPWGLPGDIPVPANFDGDNRADLAVYRPSEGRWYVRGSTGAIQYGIPWGLSGDIPVAANFDGDGRADLAVYRPSEGRWYVRGSTGAIQYGIPWGLSGDIPVAARFDGDNRADLAVFRPSEGRWYVRGSTGAIQYGIPWGLPGDIPTPGDFDGDNRADMAVYRPSEARVLIRPVVATPSATLALASSSQPQASPHTIDQETSSAAVRKPSLLSAWKDRLSARRFATRSRPQRASW